MIINLITYASLLHKQSAVRSSHEALLSELEKYFTVKIIDHKEIEQLTNDDFKIIFIATGGTERLVIQDFEHLPRPAVILADGMQNSLAAALEVSSWLRGRGMKSEILHGEHTSIAQRIRVLYTNFQAQRSIVGSRVGVIGTPSSWLVASGVDYLMAKRRWGVDFIDIPLEQVYNYYDQIENNQVEALCHAFSSQALATREVSHEDLLKAMRLYLAIRRICGEEKLGAISLSCFRLLDRTTTTGCLALSLLNDEGIIAGCEGDLQTLFTMLAAKAMTGKVGFMANPSMVIPQTNELVLAHCTVGVSLTERYIIRNHFESNSGVGIQGILPTGDVTILRCGGECLDEYYLTSGTLMENTNYINMCRTQVRVKLDSSTNYFLKNPLGNHHVIIQGNYEEGVQEFFQANACKRIE